jgi:chromosome segregation ATPase
MSELAMAGNDAKGPAAMAAERDKAVASRRQMEINETNAGIEALEAELSQLKEEEMRYNESISAAKSNLQRMITARKVALSELEDVQDTDEAYPA